MDVAPLPHEYMIIGLIGFFISFLWVSQYSRTWSFALGLFCLLLVIASLVSISGPIEPEDLVVKK